MRANNGIFKGLNPTVTVASKILVIGFVIFCAVMADTAGAVFEDASNSILNNFKWFYLTVVSGVLVFLIYLAISRYGHVRLGRDDERPEFSFVSWIAMLFSGGMGIGLIFWSVAEPMHHFGANPFAGGFTNESATAAMRLTFFHWGLHPWAIFAIVALVLSYFAYRKDLPLTLRSVLYPLIGNRIYGPIGHTVDILTVAVTAFGVSQSLGLGVIQMNTGLNNVFGLEVGFGPQLIMIALISLCAIASVMSGIGRGIRRLSEWNMILSLVILAIVLLLGPTRYILNTLLESTGDYMQSVIGLSLWSDAQGDSGWQNWWTAFYWPWWMTWAPFVGMFIARISRGRTIRELVFGALIVPTLVTFVWMSVLGGSALKAELDDRAAFQAAATTTTTTPDGAPAAEAAAFEGGTVYQATQAETTAALFTLFDTLNIGVMGQVLSVLACLLLATYFITSADSGTLVLCTLNAVGDPEPPQAIRIVWGIVEAGIAAGLLYAGGLKAIQTASIIAGLPIAVFTVIMTLSVHKALRSDDPMLHRLPTHRTRDTAAEADALPTPAAAE